MAQAILTSAPASAAAELTPPAVKVENVNDAPVKRISPDGLRTLAQRLDLLFMQYRSDRRIAELRWLRNQRQYLGLYDPDVESELNANRSKAYPRVTRVKCISVLARLMNLMFPGNERNWELKAAPQPDITLEEVRQAIAEANKRDQDAGVDTPPLDKAYITSAIQEFMKARVAELSVLIDDQLQELGGAQDYDYVALNRKVIQSGILYGLGILRGPFVRKDKTVVIDVDAQGQPTINVKEVHKPIYDFVPIWDFYPDMSAKTFASMDGFFMRQVMSRSQVRDLARRPDFFGDQIKKYLQVTPQGNYRPLEFETELRAMGVKINVNEQKSETMKYEVISWHGKMSGELLRLGGVDVPEDKLADDLDAELWMIGGNTIKCVLNPWKDISEEVKTLHVFLFDEDDTSPVGFGLPNAMRDSQMVVSAATRMLLDNASVVCGPQLEINTELLRPDTDFASIAAYKIWLREGMGPDAQVPAVRNIEINSHLADLSKIIEMFLAFADTETFVGPATGGDMAKTPSEPMRTAAGASMLRGDAALPFKDIVRSYDRFTQSLINSMVHFNKALNPDLAPMGDYDVIARGATSLIAKEIRGAQADQLAATLTPDETIHVDARKLVEARVRSRDMEDILVSQEEADRRQQQQDQQAEQQQQQAAQMQEATVRKLLSDAFKNIAQGQKNTATADASTVQAVLDILDRGLNNGAAPQGPVGTQQTALPGPQLGGGAGAPGAPGGAPGGGQGAFG
jgi:hypothetical protein